MKKPKKPDSSKPRYITVQILGASGDNMGLVHEGWFVCIGGEVALVDKFGRALRDRHGKFYLQQVRAGEPEMLIAKRLLRRHYNDAPDKGDHAQSLRYPAA